jgi:hypothetical protein
MNTESIDCRRVADFDAIEKPGDFYFEPVQGMGGDTCLHIQMPDGAFICIAVARGGNTTPKVWGWDGNEDRPTITPSIHCIDRWHGWLEAGRLRSC